MKLRLRVGTRGSTLAVTQAGMAVEQLHEAARDAGLELDAELVRIRTSGDRAPDRPFAQIGPKGVFAVELQRALVTGEVDVAVHSLKDLPAAEPDGLVIGAVPEREDPRDALVSPAGVSLKELPAGAVVGTSSERRRALVSEARTDLTVTELRGNVDTRLGKVARGDVDAAVLAAAGLVRLGRSDAITELLDTATFVPAPGQGALAIECRADRLAAELGWIRGVEHLPTRVAVDAERAFALSMEGGCTLPLGAHASRDAGGGLVLDVFVAVAGRAIRESARGDDPDELGRRVAATMLARLDG